MVFTTYKLPLITLPFSAWKVLSVHFHLIPIHPLSLSLSIFIPRKTLPGGSRLHSELSGLQCSRSAQHCVHNVEMMSLPPDNKIFWHKDSLSFIFVYPAFHIVYAPK